MMTYEELFDIKEGIVLLAGEYSMIAHIDGVGIIPEVNFRTYSPDKRGLIAYPEGYSHSFMDGSWYSNHPMSLIKNCEKLVKDGWSGVILTNSHFVIDAIHLFSKKYGTPVRFFLSDERGVVEEDMNKIYKSFCRAIDTLDELRDELENEEED